MGQKPLRWTEVARHVRDLRELLRGGTVEIEGRATRMLHWPGQAPARPIDVPFVVAVNGSRGQATALELGCGIFTTRPRPGTTWEGFPSVTLMVSGTILEGEETPASPRAMAAVGPQLAVAYHAFLEQADPRLESLPNGARFLELALALPESERHLYLHEGHLTNLNAIDRQVMTPQLVAAAPLIGRPDEVREKLSRLEAVGVTEVAYQPAGDDLARELRTFASAAGVR
jgi:5,10-methylenetetrahydromethanopterin reductase